MHGMTHLCPQINCRPAPSVTNVPTASAAASAALVTEQDLIPVTTEAGTAITVE